MRLMQSLNDRRRYRVMVSELYDDRLNRYVWRAVGGLALAVLLVMAASFARAETTLTVRLSDPGSTLTVRAKASLKGEQVGTLFDGDAVRVVSEKGGWAYVTGGWEAGDGYVKAEYLTDDSGEPGKYRNASGGRLRVRDEPDGKATGWLKRGKTVAVTAWRGGWAWVGSGWVDGQYLEVAK